MSEYKAVSSRLSFRGEKSSSRSLHLILWRIGWVFATSVEDLVGPIFIIFNNETLACLQSSDNDSSITVHNISPTEQLSTVEPDEVNCVFVGARVVGSNERITLKTYKNKYISTDKFGVITAEHEAIGPQEEWLPIVRDDGIAFQSIYDKFLSIDEIAGGGYKIRADVETIGFCETFRVKCQARFRKKQKVTKKEDRAVSEVEVEQIKKYQTWGGGRIRTSEEDVNKLRRAKKEGKFSEALLDRREKVKADRYCK
ncbi:9283_t:CDS:2 [Paraglomus brasilianum]|uniref:9283_t:CDS:1 n=1 Tax=Paraglomus brasilianum TaxID=144538 RepID=A0A9N8YXC8_9GLOM|nr:9283_t:CDS:2 [Paraglomus brasilianum]